MNPTEELLVTIQADIRYLTQSVENLQRHTIAYPNDRGVYVKELLEQILLKTDKEALTELAIKHDQPGLMKQLLREKGE